MPNRSHFRKNAMRFKKYCQWEIFKIDISLKFGLDGISALSNFIYLYL